MSGPSASPTSRPDVLAANRTRRPDALKSFQIYTGGWNIVSMDYLASAGYTGMPGFVISLLWIVTGFLFIVMVACMYLCCKDSLKPKPNFDRFGNYTTLGLLILFTVLTIAGCGALFTGLEGLHSDVSTVITYVMAQFTAAAQAGVSSVPPIAAPQAAQTAAAMEKATNSTSMSIHAELDSIRIWFVILSASMLVLALMGLAFVACQIKSVIYTLVTLGWLLVVGTWILCGVFLLLSAVFGDTCVAMQEWAADPRTGTSMDVIVKCGSSSNSSSQSQTPPNPTVDSCAQLQQAFVPIFNTIVTNNCPSVCRNAKWVWVALITLSTGSTVSICLWIVFTRRCTMRLTKVDGGDIPMFQFQDSSKQNDKGGYLNTGAYSSNSTGPSTPNNEDVNGGSRRRSKPKTVNVHINT